jgi:predicted nucleotidyltransferase
VTSRKDIQAYAEAIARRFKPRRIILFGSHAYGKPSPDSDVDLLVILPHHSDSLDKAYEIRNELEHPGFPLDLLVRTPRELRQRMSMGDYFLAEILQKGTLLYAGAGA